MPAEPAAPGPGPCVATALRKASRRATQLYDSALAGVGLRSTQFAILAELQARASSPPTLRELADALAMDRSGLGHGLQTLERAGLVALRRSPADARHRLVALTEQGRAAWQAGVPHWRAAQQRLVDAFGAAEAQALRRALLRLAAVACACDPLRD